MGDLLVSTLPYAIAAALAAPIVAVVSALILAKSKRPLRDTWVFTAAAGSLDALIAAILLFAFWGSTNDAGGDAGAWIDVVLGVVFAALGISALVRPESPEQQAALRGRVDGFLSRGIRGMVVLGLGAQIVNFDAIAVFAGGLKEIVADQPTVGQAAVTVAVMLAVMLAPYYGPALYYAASPERAATALARMSEWLLMHSRMLEIVVGIGYGSIFLVKGITAL
jgi:hypothetical protein